MDERYTPEGGYLWAVTLNEATAELTKLGKHVVAGGDGTCHVTVATGGKHVIVANYMGGTVSAVERMPDGSLGACTALISEQADDCTQDFLCTLQPLAN